MRSFAGGRHPGDLLAPALSHPVVVDADGARTTLAGLRLDGGPAHKARALLGDMAPTDQLVGLAVGGRDSGPAAQVPSTLEPRDVADLCHEDRGQYRADTREGLNGLVAEVASERGSDLLFEHGDLAVDKLDQIPQAFHPDEVGIGQGHLV